MTELPPPEAAERRPGVFVRIVALLARFGRAHRRTFLKGCAGALVMVITRLAMPWPAHQLMHYWKLSEHARADALASHQILGLDWSLTLGLAFLVLLAALGATDALTRVQFASFSIATMRDVRAAAIRSALGAAAATPRDGAPDNDDPASSGDLVARLVGDTARVKAGLKGFLVHVVPNSALFLGVTIILYVVNFKLGLILGAAGLGMALVTVLGARAMYSKAKKYRKKEGKLAVRIDRSLRSGEVDEAFAATNKASGKAEAALTRIQSRTTWSTYVLFGLAILATVCVGSREIAAGTLEPRDMVLFLMYALILRGPTVRLARQGSRLGKTFGSARRVLKVMERPPAAPAGEPAGVGVAAPSPQQGG